MGRIVSSNELVGAIKTHSANTAPIGYLTCDGSPVSRIAYAALFAVIGTTWGVGDGSTTFNLPDLRGRTLRGRDAGAGNDPNAGARSATNGGASGDNVGSVQGDATAVKGLATSNSSVSGSFSGSASVSGTTGVESATHTHETYSYWLGTDAGSGPVQPACWYSNSGNPPPGTYPLVRSSGNASASHTHAFSGSGSASGSISGTATAQVLSGDAETRMKNVNVLFVIKY